MRILPVLALGAAAVGGALVSSAQPQPVLAQNATCSSGSDLICEINETCTERAWTIHFGPIRFNFGPCVAKAKERLYFKRAGQGQGAGSNAPKKDKSEDKDAGEDSGEGSAA